jgi:hypothetical protein
MFKTTDSDVLGLVVSTVGCCYGLSNRLLRMAAREELERRQEHDGGRGEDGGSA